MVWIWIFTGMLTTLCLQVLIGNLHLALPLLPLAAFYYAVPYGRSRTALVGLPLAGLLDALLLERAMPCTLAAGGALLLARFWRRHGNSRLWLVQAAPGAVIGLQSALLELLSRGFSAGIPVSGQWAHRLLYLAWMALAGGLLMPAAALLLDACAGRLGLPRFSDARRHITGLAHEAVS